MPSRYGTERPDSRGKEENVILVSHQVLDVFAFCHGVSCREFKCRKDD
jgi:hypothetical protein